jgi:ribosome-associated protein
MTKTAQRKTFSPLVDAIVDGLEDIKGEKITILNLQNLENSVCDYFVICQANSNTQVKALADSVEKKVRETLNDRPWHVEGAEYAEWILIDYVSVAVHVFQSEARDFYDLEGLWADATITQL